MIDYEQLDKLVDSYKDFFANHRSNGQTYWQQENFKWLGVKTFQENWDVDAADFAAMLHRSLDGVKYLLASHAYFPQRMIEDFAQRAPEDVRKMFKDLYNENIDVGMRIMPFKQKAAHLLTQVGNNSRSHFQDERTISVYLWLRYPEKYFIYRFTRAQNLSKLLRSDHKFSKGYFSQNLRSCLGLYSEIAAYLRQNEELQQMVRANFTDACYNDPNCHLLTADFAFYVTQYYLNAEAETAWQPEGYAPGITTEDWVSLLADPNVYNDSAKRVIERLADFGGQATCTQLAQKYGGTANAYNSASVAFAKRVHDRTNCPLAERADESVRWWAILYQGKKADQNDDGVYLWKLRPELAEAFKIIHTESAGDDPDTTVYTKEDFLAEVFLPEEKYDEMREVLLRKKNLILQGAPGVGKTFAAKRLAYSILGEQNDENVRFVQFHQSYSYEDFVGGYKPTATGFAPQDGVFKTFCDKAKECPEEKFFFLIDEINRGNLSKIFGELLMLIEAGYRGTQVTLEYDGRTFTVPQNVYIIGMMNTADRSLAMIDYALRRRFSFVEMEPGFSVATFAAYRDSKNSASYNALVETVEALNIAITQDETLGRGFCIGHSYFIFDEPCSDSLLRSIVKYDILPMLQEYWFDNRDAYTQWENRLLEAIP